MTTVATARQALCRWCRSPAQHLRDGVALCKPCASVVDELAEHTHRSTAGGANTTPEHVRVGT